jgi:Domain of unknown function (DUF5060)
MRNLTLVSYIQVLLCFVVLSTATAFNDVDDAQPISRGRKRNVQQQQQPSQSALLPPQPQGNANVAPLLLDNVEILSNIKGREVVRSNFADSYSDGNACYCTISTFDHGIGDVVVDTPFGMRTVRQVCALLGDGPNGRNSRPLYNDIQCGNGPPNNVGDEQDCPGRVEYGSAGCPFIGPKWNFTSLLLTPNTSPIGDNKKISKPTLMTAMTPTVVPTKVLANTPTSAPIKDPVKAPVKAPLMTSTDEPNNLITDEPTNMGSSANTPTLSNAPMTTTTSIMATPTELPSNWITLLPSSIVMTEVPTSLSLNKMTETPTALSLGMMTDTPSNVVEVPTQYPIENDDVIKTPTMPPSNDPTAATIPVPTLPERRATIQNLVLYDTTTSPATKIDNLQRKGTIFDLTKIGKQLTIVAEVDNDVNNYLVFTFDSNFTNIEYRPYYTLNGNDGLYFNSFRPLVTIGMHTVTASLYDARTNSLVSSRSYELTIVDTSSSSNPMGPFVGFDLIDCTDYVQQTLPSIIDLDVLGTSLSINAITESTGTVHAVTFWFDNAYVRKERNLPWALGGNKRTKFRPSPLLTQPGRHTITAVAVGFENEILGVFSATFRVAESTAPTKTPTPTTATTSQSPIPTIPVPTYLPTLPPINGETLDPTSTRDPTGIQNPTPSSQPIQTPSRTSSSPSTVIVEQTIAPTQSVVLSTVFPSLSGSSTTNEPTSITLLLPTTIPSMRFDTKEPVPARTSFPIPTIEPSVSPTLSSVIIPNTEKPVSSPDATAVPSSDAFETVFPTMEPPVVTSVRPTVATLGQTITPTAVTLTPTLEPEGDSTLEPTVEPTAVTLLPTLERTVKPTDITLFPTSGSTGQLTGIPTLKLNKAPRQAPVPFPKSAPVAIPAPVVRPLAPISMPGGAVISGELRKWHKVTLQLTGPFASETDPDVNPFLDYRLDVTFTHQSTKSQFVVPGYFAADGNAAETSSDSGSKWHCHFAPDTVGIWNYTINFVQGKNVAVNTGGTPTSFHGTSGSFDVATSNKSGRDNRGKGRLRYVGDHHLQFAEGEWFLKAGADRYVVPFI